jgi:hypothetical protein
VASSWIEFLKKIGWGLFLSAVIWFLLALVFADWESPIVNYYRHLGL